VYQKTSYELPTINLNAAVHTILGVGWEIGSS